VDSSVDDIEGLLENSSRSFSFIPYTVVLSVITYVLTKDDFDVGAKDGAVLVGSKDGTVVGATLL